MDATPPLPEVGKLPGKIQVHYIKTSDYRPIHVDGVVGGPTPHGLISLAVWSEHGPIPQTQSFAMGVDGNLGDEIKEERLSRSGFVRDVSASLIMTPELARIIGQLLINTADTITAELAKKQSTPQ